MRLQEIFKQFTTESRYVKPNGSEVFNHPAINFIKRPSTMGALVAVFAQAALGTDGDMAKLVMYNAYSVGSILFADNFLRLITTKAYSTNAIIDRDPQTNNVKTSPRNHGMAKIMMNSNRNMFILNSILFIPALSTGSYADDTFITVMMLTNSVNWYRHKQVVDGKYEVLDTPPKHDKKLGEKKESKFGQALPEPLAI
jgi:hypothetical protein